MRLPRAATVSFAVVFFACGTANASAQSDTSNPDVVPAPATPGDGVLLYPGGQYGRVVHPLLQPGDPFPGTAAAPLRLHMPRKHLAKKVTPPAAPTAVASTTDNSASPASTETSAASTAEASTNVAPTPAAPAVAAPPAQVKPKHPAKPAKTQVANQTPAPAPTAPLSDSTASFGASAVPFSFGSSTASNSAPPVAPPARVAKASPPPAQTLTADNAPLPPGLAKQTQILFAAGAPDPSADSIDEIKGLAPALNSALAAGTSRIQIVAYGGARGDKSSEARRLSLRRGRIIRQLLIDGGVPAERIDVRAMGGVTDGAAADRVDIFTKA